MNPPRPRKPNFLVIGAQKAGTTYLCAGLTRHPDVYFSDPKELMFFNQPQPIGQEDFNAYLERHFAGAAERRWVGEGSTTYFQWPRALPRIREYLGDELRIILCLRHPVEKALSFYLHNWRKGRLKGDESILEFDRNDVENSPLGTSFYANHLERWLDVFGRDGIHVMRFDLLRENRLRFLQSATEFLGVSPLRAASEEIVNPGPQLKMSGNHLVVRRSAKQDSRLQPRFTMDDVARLQSLFGEDIERTEQLLSMDLSAWKRLPDFGL